MSDHSGCGGYLIHSAFAAVSFGTAGLFFSVGDPMFCLRDGPGMLPGWLVSPVEELQALAPVTSMAGILVTIVSKVGNSFSGSGGVT